MCKSKAVNKKDAEFFYKPINENQLDQDNIKEKIQLIISMDQANYNSKYSVGLVLYSANNRSNGGETEIKVANSNQLKFDKFFIMTYYFEKEQPIEFVVSCNDTQFRIKSTLGKIMGSRGQLFTASIPSGEKMIIHGKSLLNYNSISGKFEVSLNGTFNKKTLTYVIMNLGNQSNPSTTIIYRSEIKEGIGTITFDSVSIPTIYLCNGDMQNTLIGIEIYGPEKLGETSGVFNQLITKPINIQLKSSSCIRTAQIKCKLTKQYSFLDYLRGGMQIALTIGIDFTGSNKNPQHPQSLHNITTLQMNSYERAIKSCGDIVAYYDYDQLFPVFGYGAILPGYNEVNHCFPLNRSHDPNIYTINGVLSCYRAVVPTLNFYGPTIFAPIINNLNNTVKQDLSQGKTMIYNILMILTDGQINDMDDTIDALVEASFLPISVIIIGIGIAEFGNMDILDADDNPLYDRRGRKAARDLVQFVPFYKYQNDGQKLSEEVLEEIPRQVIEYFEQNNIIPGDPIVSLAGKGYQY